MPKKDSRISPVRISVNVADLIHPGQYVRDSVLIPKKLSVISAAKLVGVGRPALSNFLNGHVGATTDMASRIEVAFGVPAQALLDMQAAYDAAQAKSKGAPINAMPYVPPFLGIKSIDIERWVARNIPARTRLPVLLRTLVNSTNFSISKIDFPGNDDAERSGWDGYIETEQATPWIPQGISGWEFGTNQDIKDKADGDFSKSIKNIAKTERNQTTFVFVTPRHWPGKFDWINEKKSKGLWKDVRAYDSSDLEQWLEQSVAGQTWFANETQLASKGVRTLDRCWIDWSEVARPPLVGTFFSSAIESAKRMMLAKLSKPADEPIVVAADSVEEAVAFLAQLFGPTGGYELEKFRDRILVFDQQYVLSQLAQGTKDFIAVATNRQVERELGPLARSLHSIVVYPRNAANTTPHVVLEPLNFDVFRKSLEEMQYGRDDIARFSNESGRSLTVLRRRLANVPAVRTPEWAADHQTAASLIPFLFIGTWSSVNQTDQTALTLLANSDCYEDLEKQCQKVIGLNDAPLWSAGSYRGVISKIDLLFAIAASVTTLDLQRYFDMAKIVLSEDDPKLDLPEADRWAASLHGKSREFSTAARQGISETLVLLAVHGNHLFRARLGFDCEGAVTRLVRELLTPLKTRILEANDRDLTAYAEAAPGEFLSILEGDLLTENPECYGLLRPANADVFGAGCSRTGLLWALEGLAWNPNTLHRAALILAQLAGIEINDNWVNKPIHSLQSIFRAWMPQTAADHDTRLRVVNLLVDKFPKAAWNICIEQINMGHQTGDYSHKPRWRNDAHGFGEPFSTWAPIHAFTREMIDIVLSWKHGYTSEMLCDLVQRLHDISEDHQAKVWHLVKTWAEMGASDSDKAIVREKIRVTVMSRWGVKRSGDVKFAKLSVSAKASYQLLEPVDLLSKHEWLFRDHWIDESADELADDDIDFHKREERITKLRVIALRDIFKNRGVSGIFELAEKGKAASLIGWLMGRELLTAKDIPGIIFTSQAPTLEGHSWARKSFITGLLSALQEEDKREGVLRKIKDELSRSDFARLLLLAPFRRGTWKMVDELDDQHRQIYWGDVIPSWIHDADIENNEAVARLLAVGRPRAAFTCVHFRLEIVEQDLLFRLMSEMVKSGNDQPGHYRLDHYHIEQAFRILDKNTTLTLDQKASLELAYIDALSSTWRREQGYGIPNLERYVEAHPELFAQAVVWTYKRKEEGEDPPEWKVSPEQVQHFAERGYKLLDGLHRMPGHDDLGELQVNKLTAWVKKVRDTCALLGRLDIGDTCIGKLFSGAPVGKDGIWPCEPVRQVMEEVHSKKLMNGAHTGLYNSRGATWRDEGGGQERALAGKYRIWANALQYSHPFVSTELLMDMVKTYEFEANREDTEAEIRKRLN